MSSRGALVLRLLLPLLLAAMTLPARRGSATPASRAAESAAALRIRAELEAGRFEEAEAMAREQYAAMLREHGEGSLEHARATDLLVEALLGGGKALEVETESLARRAVALKIGLLAPSDPDLAVSLALLGRLHLDRGDSARAVALTRQAFELQEAAVGGRDAILIPTLRHLGNALLANGELAGAEEAYRLLGDLVALHRGEMSMDAASHAYSTARLMIEVGDWEEARRLYQKSADIVEKLHGTTNARMAYALLGVGNANAMLGDWTAALEAHEQALAIAGKTLRKDHPFLASCYTGIGYALQEMGDLEAAREAFATARDLARREYGPLHIETGRALHLLAGAERRANDLDEAESHLSEAFAIFERSPDRNLRLEARIEHARLLTDRGKIDEAIGEMQGVLRETAEFLPNHPDMLNRSDTLAALMLRSGRPGEARSVLRAAVDRFTNSYGEDYVGYIEALVHLALAAALTGRTEEALQTADRAETLGIERARILMAGLSEQRAIRFAEQRATALDLLVTLAATGKDASAVPAAWNSVIRSRGAVLDELARRHHATRLGDSAAAQAFVVASRRLANLLVQGPSGDVGGFVRNVAEARRRREDTERELARASRAFRAIQAEREIGIEQVRDALPDGSALVAYVLYERNRDAEPRDQARSPSVAPGRRSEYAAFVMSGNEPARLVRLGGSAEIDTAVQATRTSLKSGLLSPDRARENSYRAAATTLRSLIWDPVAPLIGKAKRVFIVPDGTLHVVSFATFPMGEGLYLAEAGRILHYLSAERDLVSSPGTEAGRGLLVVGGPDYDAISPVATEGRLPDSPPTQLVTSSGGEASDCPPFSVFRFEPLDGAAAEARAVAGRWGAALAHGGDDGVLLLSGPEALEERFKRAASGRRVLHLATHGFFLDGECPIAFVGQRGFGAVAADSGGRQDHPRLGENPLVLSGLALAGANRRSQAGPDQEDGILMAEEIAALDLRGTEWAVLSGCDTGLGVIRPGEGVFGLRRAFQIAGARTLIMTLWPVGDAIAAEWIDRLYEKRLDERLDTAASVAAATAEVLKGRRDQGLSTHPVLWGAFVASGDWR